MPKRIIVLAALIAAGFAAWWAYAEYWKPSGAPPVFYGNVDIHDVALALGQGTPGGDVSGDLVDVGAGRPEDLEGKDLTGKVVLSSSGLNGFAAAQQKGAVGIIGYTALRPNDYTDQIPDTRFNPPTGATTAWTCGVCSRISSAIVP